METSEECNKFVKAIHEKYGIPVHMINNIVMPVLHEKFVIRGIVYEVVYIKEGQLQFSAKPVGTAIPRAAEKTMAKIRLVHAIKDLIGTVKVKLGIQP